MSGTSTTSSHRWSPGPWSLMSEPFQTQTGSNTIEKARRPLYALRTTLHVRRPHRSSSPEWQPQRQHARQPGFTLRSLSLCGMTMMKFTGQSSHDIVPFGYKSLFYRRAPLCVKGNPAPMLLRGSRPVPWQRAPGQAGVAAG